MTDSLSGGSGPQDQPGGRCRQRAAVGFGRVGQNIARVLESQGFEYIALDLDPARIRAARQVEPFSAE